ncbi:MAG: PhzF family phenazine biosynthesis protein [Alphaproteobacteria bacterium]|nr:PhzF family phenazine biosynthesis protein [Alphaproteobacteria bacterium]
MKRAFHQLDVFSAAPLGGNPLAVVHDADGLDEATMAAFARWTNLSETTFLLRPTVAAADYRVRIFTPGGELPFAGHPTLGSCQAWINAGGRAKQTETIVQECGVGLVRIRRTGTRLAFAAPPLQRSGPLESEVLAQIARGLRVRQADIVHHQWVANGPAWAAVMLPSAAAVRALEPDWAALRDLKVGAFGPQPPGSDSAFEVRAFAPGVGVPEDPVTGSLNAGLAIWLIGAGLAPARYVAAQGSALGRQGRVYVEKAGEDIWIGGDVTTCVAGTLDLG